MGPVKLERSEEQESAVGGEATEGIAVRLCWILEGKTRIQEFK